MSSGLPRFSTLPQPRSNRHGSIDSGGSSSVGSSLPTPSGRISAASSRRPESITDISDTAVSPQRTGNRRSMLIQPSHIKTSSISRPGRPGNMIGGRPMSPPLRREVPEAVQEVDTPGEPAAIAVPASRRPRPSLSDRTIESLSQVPPSPSLAKRRQSGFFMPESPMASRPESRAESRLGNGRPASRMGASAGVFSPVSQRPASPSKRPMTSASKKPPAGLVAPGKRSVSDKPTVEHVVGGKNGATPGLRRPGSGMQLPSRPTGLVKPTVGGGRGLGTTSKTVGAKPTPRSPVKDVFEPGITKPKAMSGVKSLRPPATKPARPFQSNNDPANKAPSSRMLPKTRKPVSPTIQPEEHDEPLEEQLSPLEDDQPQEDHIIPPAPVKRNMSPGSKTLRDMIAKQRAAAQKKLPGSFAPRAAAVDTGEMGIGMGMGPDADPNMLDFEDSRFVNLIRKRVNTAKREGKLNVSSLGLTEIPPEILKLYESDPDAKDSVAFYEMVDVTKLQAAENEIVELPDAAFPPLPEEEAPEAESGQPAFSCLESIDLRGNQLRSLPPRLAALERLTSLNFSRNKLDLDSLFLISSLTHLSELRLAENGLDGALPACLGELPELEVLDLRGNKLTELPQELGKLNKLKRLDVTGNRLETIPFEAIFDLPLIEVLASRNKLTGALFAPNITQVPHLQILDVSVNALVELSEEKVDLPRLKVLNIANNRVAALPDVSQWQELATINAEENKISALPDGFAQLQNLKSANFSNNSLLALDDKIAQMKNLTSFQISNNPIRERRLMKLGIEALKSELQTRLEPQPAEQEVASPNKARFNLFLGSSNGTSPIGSGPPWTASAGVVDKSQSKLRDIETPHLEPLIGQGVHTLILHHNWLQQIPSTVGLLGASLKSLDLSNNRLNKTNPFVGGGDGPLHLPNLTILNLTSNALTSLDSLVQGNLLAPLLATLIVPFNRITALPSSPSLREAFPQLAKLIAANNVISSLEVEAVRGLQVLDLSSNEIESLPARLGTLQGSLRTLMVNGNRFKVPGWGVLEKGTEEVLKWCRMKIPAGEEGSLAGGGVEE